jgi:hypothetical protein
MSNLWAVACLIASVWLGFAILASVILNSALVVTMLERETLQKRRKAEALRAHWLATLGVIRESLVPRSRALEQQQQEMYEPIQYLWLQADVLEPDELLAVNRCSASLLALRHRPSLNQSQARVAQSLIDETSAVLAQAIERLERSRQGEIRARKWLRAISELFGLREGAISTVRPSQTISQTGVRQ